jgi:N-acetylglutamate synthase
MDFLPNDWHRSWYSLDKLASLGASTMQITRNDRVRMERAHVLAWPALRAAKLDGWLWRSSGGGSQRANSVSTIDFTGNDIEAAIDTIEARYQALGAPSRFQTFDETSPPELPDRLRHRGYHETESTTTMFRRNEPVAPADHVEQRDHPWQDWQAVYFSAITENRHAINAQILASIQAPHAFFCYRTISTALCIIGHGCAVVECIATSDAAKRQGAARTVMTALLAWAAAQDADLAGLQVVAQNTPAIRLYETLGFVAGATNRFWVKA